MIILTEEQAQEHYDNTLGKIDEKWLDKDTGELYSILNYIKDKKMKTYKVTITFEVEDNPNFLIEERIKGQSLELTEQDLLQGFADPEFEKLNCTIKEVK